MEKFFHGSSVLFDKFDLSHALEGDGKVKFGYGVYLTQYYSQAALYAGKAGAGKPQPVNYYVYTVEAPQIKEDNFISLVPGTPVNPAIVERAEQKLGFAIPAEAVTEGKFFRKYIANALSGNAASLKKMISSATPQAEKAASEFLLSIGVELLVWPVVWSKPDGAQNVAVLDDKAAKIIKVEQIELDGKGKLVPGSEKEV